MRIGNKGFTLVEVIVTITILGITTLVALPIISSLQGQLNNNKYKVYNESLESAAKLYNDSYDDDMFGRKTQGCYKLSFDELSSKKLLEDIEANKNISCNNTGTYVIVIKSNGTYTYQSSLKCTDEHGNVVYEKSDVTGECSDDEDESVITIQPSPLERNTPFNPANESESNKNQYIIVNSNYGFCSNMTLKYQWVGEGVESTDPVKYDFNNQESTKIGFTSIKSKKIKIPTKSGTYKLLIEPTHICAAQDSYFYSTNYDSDKKFLFDFDKPNITVDYDINKQSDNVTIHFTDNMGLKSYSVSTSNSPSDWESISGTDVTKTLTLASGTYYFFVKDLALNANDTSKVIKVDIPTAPVITGGSTSWYKSNRIIWASTLSTSLSSISKYQYCVSNTNSSSGCSWNDLYNNSDGVSNEGLDIAYYHSSNSDLIDKYAGSVPDLNNHYTNYGASEGRGKSNSDWVRTSHNFSNEGNYYVFFRGVSSGGLTGPASNSQKLNIDKTNPTCSYTTSANATSISVNVTANDNLSGIKTYYFKIDGQSYKASTTNTYTFSGLGISTSHTIYAYVVDNAGNRSSVVSRNVSTTSMIFGQYLRTVKTTGFNSSVLGRMYRYTGKNANNYVCIGTEDKNTCINNKDRYLYRVIGVVQTADGGMGTSVDMVKVIKNSISGNVVWGDYTRDVYWDASGVRSHVNSLNYGSHENLIANINWRHGTNMRHTNSANTMFNIEASWGWRSTSKKAIMYASDYLYATGNPNQVCTDDAGADACTNTWIYLGGGDGNKRNFEYLLDYSSTSVIGSHAALIIRNFTIVNDKAGALWPEGTSEARRVRPVFYLKSSTYYKSGSGTSNNPFIIRQ